MFRPNEKSYVFSSAHSTVIVVVGPIGSGKTSMMNNIVSQKDNDNFIAIDGDELSIGEDNVKLLKAERNPYSMWKIIEALLLGKVPVISTGGGVLHSSKGNLFLRETIQKVLNININLVVMCPSLNVKNITLVNENSLNENSLNEELSTLYNNLESVKSVVNKRVQTGAWELPDNYRGKGGADKFANFIAGKSKQNKKFAESLLKEADYAYFFPKITGDNYEKNMKTIRYQVPEVIKKVVYPSSDTTPLKGKFTQIRILCKIHLERTAPIIGHITWEFDQFRRIEMGKLEFQKVPRPSVDGKIYTIEGNFPENNSSENKKKKKTNDVSSPSGGPSISLVIPEESLHEDGRTHITVKSGVHEPKWMAR